jgi:hypothetical protein
MLNIIFIIRIIILDTNIYFLLQLTFLGIHIYKLQIQNIIFKIEIKISVLKY